MRDATHLTEKQLMMSLWEPIIESSDTTLVTSEWAMYELAKNPECQERLYKEVVSVVGTERMVTEDDLPHMPYLKAVIKETLRQYPPVPMVPSRLVEEDITLGGYDIPKGHEVCHGHPLIHSSFPILHTLRKSSVLHLNLQCRSEIEWVVGFQILVNLYAVAKDSAVWSNPEKWDPERVLGDNSLDMGFKNFNLMPFGAGKRMCAGITQVVNPSYSISLLTLP